MTADLPPGTPRAAYDEQRLADLLALADGTIWSYDAGSGGFRRASARGRDADPTTCRNAAAVMAHTGGNVMPLAADVDPAVADDEAMS